MQEEDLKNNKPPIFKSWGHFYTFVIVLHAVIIALFYWFTQAYS